MAAVRDLTDSPIVLVTGASAGIGEAIVRRFAKGGFRVVAVARRQEALDRLASEITGITVIETLAVDVAALDAAEKAVALAVERLGRLDCLVNNAGSGKWATVDQTDNAMLDEVIDISLKTPFRFCRAALSGG